MGWVRGGTLALLVLGLWSCSASKTATQVMLYVTADEALSPRVASVRIEVFDPDPGNENPARDIEIGAGRDIGSESDPVQVPLVPKDGASSRYTVTVVLRDADGRELGTQTLRGGYVANEVREVWAAFDSECEYSGCPGEFRCQLGECVEYCVDAAAPNTITRSEPVPCDSSCTERACADGSVLRCEKSHRVVERQCGFGCDEAASEPACNQLEPSNVGDTMSIESNLADLVVGGGAVVEVVLNTDDGSIVARDTDQELVEQIRPPDCPGEGGGICSDIRFTPFDKEDFEVVTLDQAFNAEGTLVPIRYGVFSLGSITVLETATLRAEGDRALIMLVDRDVDVFGTISVSATDLGPGPAGYAGGEGLGATGDGPGGGGTSEQIPLPSFGVLGGGGAGGSFGGFGGSGGSGLDGESVLSGGVRGSAYPRMFRAFYTVRPLLGGSGGGSGGDWGIGGHGGGAMQLSTNGRIRLGPAGVITAGGGGGKGTQWVIGGGGGGGSGGALLLEAGELVFFPDSQVVARIGAPGGGGGGVNGPGEEEDGATGHPWVVPAPGSLGTRTFGHGGNGSDENGKGDTGEFGAEGGGGGGGGGGHVRIHTKLGEEDYDSLSDFVILFSIGEASLREDGP